MGASSLEVTGRQDLTLLMIDGTVGRGKTRLVEAHDPVWRSARGVEAFTSQGGQGLRGSVVGSNKVSVRVTVGGEA